tara:strand:+ start:1957 stop:2796 length:840 start_codon:yes stop_codon:yes gene_type:complete
MGIKALEISDHFPFLLRDEDLHAAKLRLRANQRRNKKHGRDRTDSFRSYSITRQEIKDRRYNPEKPGRIHSYTIRAEYRPAAQLEFELIQPDVLHMNAETDLPKRFRIVQVTPSDLRYFKQPWNWGEGHRYIEDGKPIEPAYTVGLQFFGMLDDDQADGLQGLVDELYRPIKQGPYSYHTQQGSGSSGGSSPTIITSTNFSGEITPETEAEIIAHYEAVKQFALEHEIITGFREEDGGPTLAEQEYERDGSDVKADIDRSNAARNTFYALVQELTQLCL